MVESKELKKKVCVTIPQREHERLSRLAEESGGLRRAACAGSRTLISGM